MMVFLDQLCAALLVREPEEIRRLLRHPLASVLPRRVRAEALLIARAGSDGLRAPVNALHFYHQTAHLFGTHADAARRHRQSDAAQPAPEAPPQLELELPREPEPSPAKPAA
jgi:hypothetical protein